MLLPRRNLRDTRADVVHYSENQEAKHATNALLANRAASTQNMNILRQPDPSSCNRAMKTAGCKRSMMSDCMAHPPYGEEGVRAAGSIRHSL